MAWKSRNSSILQGDLNLIGYTQSFPHGAVKTQMASNLSVTQSEFEDKVLKSDVPVLVDFWATWCGPCKAIGPHIEQLAEEYVGKAKVFKVDVDSDSDLATQYGVSSIPALVVFKGGKVHNQRVGAMPKKDIAALIDSAL